MIPYAEVTEHATEDRIAAGPGWRQVTPAGSKGRHYEDTAPSCDIAEATDAHFDSVSHLLRTGWATDFTGPAKANVAKYAWDNAAFIANGRHVYDEKVAQGIADAEAWRKHHMKLLRDSADVSLNEAADRGSSIHRVLEALIGGQPLDREDLSRNGAYPWLLAVQSFIIEARPEPVELEVVCFDREHMAAGTADFVGYLRGIPEIADLLCVVDWKSRTKGHDRRQKEGVQGGAYATMLSDGYFMDGRGRRNRIDVDGAIIVTFAPDGTWRYHLVDLDAAKRAYRVAVEEARLNKVKVLFPHRSTDHQPFDVNAVALQRIALIPDGSSEQAWLRDRWVGMGLPSATAGELTADDWPVVDGLLALAEEPYKPFPPDMSKPTEYASNEVCGALLARLKALPANLRDEVDRQAGGLPSLLSPVTVDEAEDWERAIVPAEATMEVRRSVALDLLEQVRQFEDDLHAAVTAAITVPGGAAAWADADFEAAEALILAAKAGDVCFDHDHNKLLPDHESVAAVESELGKRGAVAKAKELHLNVGRPKPTKWADLVADPILWAAVTTARVDNQ